MEKGRDFKIDRQEYIKLTGVDIPQKKSYAEKDSAVAKSAKKYGYEIHIIPEVIEFKKIG